MAKKTEKDIKVTAANFSLSSSWKCKKEYNSFVVWTGNYLFETGPTTASTKITFNYNIPSGAKVINSGIYATIGNPSTGISVLTMNGLRARDDGNGKRFWGIGTAIPIGGSYVAEFKFKANGSKRDTSSHSATLSFSDILLHIVYEDSTPQKPPEPVDESKLFHIPPQSVALYNQDTKGVYIFDGVIKIQHTFTSKVEEEPEKHKDEFVNSARNEPDKIVLDVMMSDVYTDSGNMTYAPGWDDNKQEQAYNDTKKIVTIKEKGDVWSRSGNAVYVLNRLKQARTLLSVITPQYVHFDMIISGISINQDSETPHGWQGQVEFVHKYKDPAPKKKNNSKPQRNGDNDPPSTGGLFSRIGAMISGNK